MQERNELHSEVGVYTAQTSSPLCPLLGLERASRPSGPTPSSQSSGSCGPESDWDEVVAAKSEYEFAYADTKGNPLSTLFPATQQCKTSEIKIKYKALYI